jgi:hypothetical protein
MINITAKQLRIAADLQEKIQSLQSELNSILGGSNETAVTEEPRKQRKKGKMSAAGRAAIRAAQVARWAKLKGTAPTTKAAKAPKKKRKMTPAWRAALERAWAARRAKTKAAK